MAYPRNGGTGYSSGNGVVRAVRFVASGGTTAEPAFELGAATNGSAGLNYDTTARLIEAGLITITVDGSTCALHTTTRALSVLQTEHSRIAVPSSTQSITGTGVAITAGGSDYMALVSADGTYTLASTPTIADGADGQEILIVNVGSNDITLQDQGTLASSNLRLDASTVTLTPRDSIRLVFLDAIGDWLQVAPVVSVV